MSHPAPAPDPQQIFNAAVAASQAGESWQAVSLFEQAIALAPQWGLPRFFLGSELAAMEQWAAAEEHLAAAVVLSPEMPLVRYQLGLLQLSSGRRAAAFVTWQPLFNDPKAGPLTDFVRGYSALAVDEFDQAREAFHRGLEQPDVNPSVADDVAKVLERIENLPAGRRSGPGETASDTLPDAHVLLANYGQHKLH